MKALRSIFKYWYLYVVTAVMGSFVINYTTRLINMPRNEETITIFVASISDSAPNLKPALEKAKPDYLREINIVTVKYNGYNFDSKYTAYGKGDADIIILPKSKINDSTLLTYYQPFQENFIDDYIETSGYYNHPQSQKSYGICVHTKGQNNNDLITYSDNSFDDDYYAFFAQGSKHIGELNDVKWTTAFSFVNIIMGK
jgi:hypothetical protein